MKLSQKRGAVSADPPRGSAVSKAVQKMNARTAVRGWMLFECEGRFMIQRIDDPREVSEELRIAVPLLDNDKEAIKVAVSQAMRGDPLIMFLVWLHGRPVDAVSGFGDAIAKLLNSGPARGAVVLAEIIDKEVL